MTQHEIDVEIQDLEWERWMISVSVHNSKRLKDIEDRLAYLNNLKRNGNR